MPIPAAHRIASNGWTVALPLVVVTFGFGLGYEFVIGVAPGRFCVPGNMAVTFADADVVVEACPIAARLAKESERIPTHAQVIKIEYNIR
jgi:hypothetical protein